MMRGHKKYTLNFGGKIFLKSVTRETGKELREYY